jgi:hypothetical protein
MLVERTRVLAASARVITDFDETDPDLAGACGVEVCALEARSLLGGGVLSRVSAAAAAGIQRRIPFMLAEEDVAAMDRLEGAVSRGLSRIDLKLATLNAEASQEGLAKIGSLIGLATGAIGLIKSVF